MYSATAAPRILRYNDRETYLWLWTQAPCAWKDNIELRFTEVPLRHLQPAESVADAAAVESQLRRMRQGRALPPLLVCATGSGALYIHDGNHRFQAMRVFFRGDGHARVRVAVAVPRPGYEFRYRWLGEHGTYLLEPAAPILSRATAVPFTGRTMVLVAHPDDETGGCAGLLQRLPDPVVVFATDGAPADPYFWGGYGSPLNYARARRQEATRALQAAGIRHSEFLGGAALEHTEFHDQQLYRVLPQAMQAISEMVRRYQPDKVLVPAYEGGHPDHDSCSFLGAMLCRRFGLPVWEMPLYHRSDTGNLVCRRFRAKSGGERLLALNRDEKRTRDAMVASYVSQTGLPEFVGSTLECYRPQADYDYSRPPHHGTLNYQVWQWPISPRQVCRAFQDCARAEEKRTAGHAAGRREAAMMTESAAASAGAS